MKVGELKVFLKEYPDNMDVAVIDSDGTIVSATIVEDGDSELDNPYEFLVVCSAIEEESEEWM
ncbi:hypothetical protein [Enterococcus spodopteracolus]|uniref:hypothetical protein n=1 Tax=Enterococcus spodopteracolus TaxID=3034501 RepID=UPI002649A0A9|nr:hypothetical protein [Enterococcus spodopteracolus]